MGYIWINTCIRRDNTAVLSARITFKGNLMMVRNEVMNKDWHREYIVAAVHTKGFTLRELSERAGTHPQARGAIQGAECNL